MPDLSIKFKRRLTKKYKIVETDENGILLVSQNGVNFTIEDSGKYTYIITRNEKGILISLYVEDIGTGKETEARLWKAIQILLHDIKNIWKK